MSVKAPAERNFRRARAKPGKRKAARSRISWRAVRIAACAVVVVYAVYRACDLVLTAPALKIQRVAVHGNVRLAAGEVQAQVRELRGTSILTANLPAYRRQLLDLPWVSDVALRRVLPSTIEVFVSERSPIGLCRLGTQIFLIDRAGVVIAEFGPQYAEFDLPIIDGLVRTPSSGEPAIDERRADLAARLIDAVAARPDLARRISQIDVSNLHDAVVLLDGDPAQLHLGEDRFLERLQSYDELATAVHERVPDVDYVDLRFGQRLYVLPAATGHRKR
jgi:cell division protein FtsQ